MGEALLLISKFFDNIEQFFLDLSCWRKAPLSLDSNAVVTFFDIHAGQTDKFIL